LWGVGNPIIKIRGFKQGLRVSRYVVRETHIYSIFILESRGFQTSGLILPLHPTPHTLYPAPSGLVTVLIIVGVGALQHLLKKAALLRAEGRRFNIFGDSTPYLIGATKF
jgi:hypothetical protein